MCDCFCTEIAKIKPDDSAPSEREMLMPALWRHQAIAFCRRKLVIGLVAHFLGRAGTQRGTAETAEIWPFLPSARTRNVRRPRPATTNAARQRQQNYKLSILRPSSAARWRRISPLILFSSFIRPPARLFADPRPRLATGQFCLAAIGNYAIVFLFCVVAVANRKLKTRASKLENTFPFPPFPICKSLNGMDKK